MMLRFRGSNTGTRTSTSSSNKPNVVLHNSTGSSTSTSTSRDSGGGTSNESIMKEQRDDQHVSVLVLVDNTVSRPLIQVADQSSEQNTSTGTSSSSSASSNNLVEVVVNDKSNNSNSDNDNDNNNNNDDNNSVSSSISIESSTISSVLTCTEEYDELLKMCTSTNTHDVNNNSTSNNDENIDNNNNNTELQSWKRLQNDFQCRDKFINKITKSSTTSTRSTTTSVSLFVRQLKRREVTVRKCRIQRLKRKCQQNYIKNNILNKQQSTCIPSELNDYFDSILQTDTSTSTSPSSTTTSNEVTCKQIIEQIYDSIVLLVYVILPAMINAICYAIAHIALYEILYYCIHHIKYKILYIESTIYGFLFYSLFICVGTGMMYSTGYLFWFVNDTTYNCVTYYYNNNKNYFHHWDTTLIKYIRNNNDTTTSTTHHPMIRFWLFTIGFYCLYISSYQFYLYIALYFDETITTILPNLPSRLLLLSNSNNNSTSSSSLLNANNFLHNSTCTLNEVLFNSNTDTNTATTCTTTNITDTSSYSLSYMVQLCQNEINRIETYKTHLVEQDMIYTWDRLTHIGYDSFWSYWLHNNNDIINGGNTTTSTSTINNNNIDTYYPAPANAIFTFYGQMKFNILIIVVFGTIPYVLYGLKLWDKY